MDWLTADLEAEIRKVFEPRYKKSLSSDETKEIARNLSNGLEQIIKSGTQNRQTTGSI